MQSHTYEADNFAAIIQPVDSGKTMFVSEIEIKDRDDTVPEQYIALAVGSLVFDLMQTTRFEEIGGPFHAVSVNGVPAFKPRDLTVFATAGGREEVDSLHLDYGLPKFMLATEDPEGHVHSLLPKDFTHLPDSPGGWHTDLTFMPNRPTRTALQAYHIGSTLRIGATSDQVRTTVLADGRWLLRKLEDETRGTELELELDSLLTTEFYSDSFNVQYEHLRGKPLTAPITHPKLAVSPTGERALTIRSFTNAHFPDGTHLNDYVVRRLDTIVEELLASADLPSYEQRYTHLGMISILSDRTPHHRGRAPHKETELRRICTYNTATYSPQFRPDEITETPPDGYQQPASIRDLEREEYSRYIEMARQNTLGEVDATVVTEYFQDRCAKFLRNMKIMLQKHPELDMQAECVSYAKSRGIPDIKSLNDFLRFVHKD